MSNYVKIKIINNYNTALQSPAVAEFMETLCGHTLRNNQVHPHLAYSRFHIIARFPKKVGQAGFREHPSAVLPRLSFLFGMGTQNLDS
jgi:hypothetical protein